MHANTLLYLMRLVDKRMEASHSVSDAKHTKYNDALEVEKSNAFPPNENSEHLRNCGYQAYGQCEAYKDIRNELAQVIYLLEVEAGE